MRTDQPRCARCGLMLVGPNADRLYGLLAEADAELDRLRELSHNPDPAAPTTVGGPAEPMAPPAAGQPARRPHRITTGSVLLALGALLLGVAAVVFVAVSWGSLSQAARTVLLLGVTAVVAVAATSCLGRRLRASTEALWALTVLLLLVDLGAAYTTGLWGLDQLGGRGLLSVAAALLALPSAGAAVGAQRVWSADGDDGRTRLVVAELAVVGGALAAVGALSVNWVTASAWLPIAALGLLVAGTMAAWSLGLWLSTVGIALAAMGAYVVAVVAAIARLFEEPTVPELVDGSARPAVVLLALTVAVAVVGPPPVGAGAALVASGLAAALVVVPAGAAGAAEATVAAATVLVVLALVGLLRLGASVDGVRAATAVGAAILLLALAERAAAVSPVLVQAATPFWSTGMGTRLPGTQASTGEPVWLALVLGASLAVTAAAALGWPSDHAFGPSTGARREWLLGVGVLALAGGALATLLWTTAPVWVVTAVALVGALTAAVGTRPAVLVPVAVVVLVGVIASAGSAGLSAAALAAAAGALLVQAVRRRAHLSAVPLAAAGVLVVDGAVLALTHQLGGTGEVAALVVVLAGMLLTVAATTVISATRVAQDLRLPSIGAEIASGVRLVGSIALAGSTGVGTAVITLGVLGLAAVVLGVLRADRRPARWLGLALLQSAWTVQLLDTDVDVVELYTLPVALVSVGLGLWALGRDASAATWRVLLPGFTLATAPSLPQALADLTSLRAWLLGAAGLVLLLTGIRLRWGAPTAVGGVVVALLAVGHLSSVASAVPRWVVLATVGGALLGAGITWESRVRDARALASYATDLR